MRYRQVNRATRVQPAGGTYQSPEWKEQISADCFRQCVYCAIHEQVWGGIDHYHIDHFKPKSKFAALTNSIQNLYYSCPVCNRFKSDDWPGTPDSTKATYLDPSDIDFETIFTRNHTDFLLSGNNVASRYMINRLYLNRPQMVYERREAYLYEEVEKTQKEIIKLIDMVDDKVLLRESARLISDVLTHVTTHKMKIRPYKISDIRKPHGK